MEQKKTKKWFWRIVLSIFAVVVLVEVGSNYYISYQYENVDSYFMYSYLPPMKNGETFKGIQMDNMGRFESIDANGEADACKKAEEYVDRNAEKYQNHLNDEDTDKRTFSAWHLRSDYTLLVVHHARNINPETVISLVGPSPQNLYVLMASLEKAGFKFKIIKDEFENEKSE